METPDFQAWVGKKFTVDLRGTKIELELTSFREFLPRFVPGLRERPFALLFRGPFAHHNFDALPRQIHEMQAEDGRIFLIYLEPIVSTGDPGRLYEAIFD
jgi:hypothetical protein